MAKPLILVDGKITEYEGSLGPGGDKSDFHAASLAAFDRVVEIEYFDEATRLERISQVTYASVLYPDCDLVKTVFWLDVGTMDQRIEKEEYVGSVFNPDSLRKVYTYVSSGIGYRRTGFYFELF